MTDKIDPKILKQANDILAEKIVEEERMHLIELDIATCHRAGICHICGGPITIKVKGIQCVTEKKWCNTNKEHLNESYTYSLGK